MNKTSEMPKSLKVKQNSYNLAVKFYRTKHLGKILNDKNNRNEKVCFKNFGKRNNVSLLHAAPSGAAACKQAIF